MAEKTVFDPDLVKSYPRASRKIALQVRPYDLLTEGTPCEEKSQTLHISPHGIEFQSKIEYPEGTLLKINVNLPEYWNLKQRFVDYGRIDAPGEFKVLAKVIKSEDIGKRGKRKLVMVQTVNIDEVDEQVLKSYLQEAK